MTAADFSEMLAWLLVLCCSLLAAIIAVLYLAVQNAALRRELLGHMDDAAVLRATKAEGMQRVCDWAPRSEGR